MGGSGSGFGVGKKSSAAVKSCLGYFSECSPPGQIWEKERWDDQCKGNHGTGFVTAPRGKSDRRYNRYLREGKDR